MDNNSTNNQRYNRTNIAIKSQIGQQEDLAILKSGLFVIAQCSFFRIVVLNLWIHWPMQLLSMIIFKLNFILIQYLLNWLQQLKKLSTNFFNDLKNNFIHFDKVKLSLFCSYQKSPFGLFVHFNNFCSWRFFYC